MKKILGSLLILTIQLFGSYTWKASVDNKTPFVNEIFLATFECFYSDDASYTYVDFFPKQEGFRFDKFDFSSRVIDGKRYDRYRFKVQALNPYKQKLSLSAMMKETTKESVQETIVGRDNDRDLVFDETIVKIKPLRLDVKKLSNIVSVVGDFKLDYHFSKQELKSYEPLQLVIEISGEGNFDAIRPFSFPIAGVKAVQNSIKKRLISTPHGQKGKIIYRYAFVGDKNFTIPAQSIEFLNPKASVIKQLEVNSTKIVVIEDLKAESLVDTIEYPTPEKPIDWISILTHFASFVLGMIVLSLYIRIKNREIKKTRVYSNIQELLQELVSRNNIDLMELIEEDMKHKRLKATNYYVKKM